MAIDNSLRTAVELMAKEDNNHKVAILSYHDIIASYKHTIAEHEKKDPGISLKYSG